MPLSPPLHVVSLRWHVATLEPWPSTKISQKIINVRAHTLLSDLFVFSCKMEYIGFICNGNAFSFPKRQFPYVLLKELKQHH